MNTREMGHTPGPWILGGCSGRMITTPDGYVGDGFIAESRYARKCIADALIAKASP